ncbi:MAG: 4-hydroxy-tetrahydrodipicolinate synthase [Lachnospirales bacterium]
MEIKDIKGIIPPIVTPVTSDEKIDEKGLINLINYVIDGGVHGVFILGSNGEFFSISFEEKLRAIEIGAKAVNGRVPYYVGVGEISTSECIKLAKEAEKLGADALSVLTPMFIQPNEEEMYLHFEEIAKSTSLPILLYNNPGRTTNNLSVGLVKRLSKIKNIVGIKNTSMDFAQNMKMIEATKDEEFVLLCGTDFYINATLSHGGVGAVAGTANVAPRLVSDIYDKFVAGDMEGSIKAQYDLMPLRDAYGKGTFPVVMKECLNILGVEVGQPIKPVRNCSEEVRKELESMLKVLPTIEFK